MLARYASDRAEIRISSLHRDATAPVLAMVARCSPETIYRRFHGVVNAEAEVSALLVPDDDRESFVAMVSGTCIGLATLATNGSGTHIGVLVEDAWQRCGVGAALVCAAVAHARRLGLTHLHADVLAESRGLLPALARIGSARTSMERGGYHVEIVLGGEQAA